MVDRSTRVRLSADVSNFTSGLARASLAARAFQKDLDASNNQMSLMVQSAVALAPAAVSMAAAAVPAIAGLTSAFTGAAAAAGVVALAFSDVGDSVSALSAFHLEPTEENLAKVREEFAKLGTAGQEFAFFIDSLRPKMQELQATAQAGMFPGMEEGIRSLMTQFPVFKELIDNVATATGELAARGGEALTDPFWTDFFDFLAVDAADSLMTFGRTIGNFAEGFAGMFQAFGPVSEDFNDSLLEMSQRFSEWGRNLSENESFEDFVEYIHRVTPQVTETLGAIGDAFADLTVAAADIGPAVLEGLEIVADVVATIARSDAGPTLIALAAGMSALSRAASAVSLLGFGALFKQISPGLKDIGKSATNIVPATRSFQDYGFAVSSAGVATDLTGSKMSKIKANAAGMGDSLRAVGKAGAGIAGLTLLMSDFDDQMGVANTATLTLMGAMGGPWVAALGAATGVVLDFIAVNDKFEASLNAVDTALSDPTGFEAQEEALRSAREEAEALDSFDVNWQDLSPNRLAVRGAQEAWGELFGGESATEQADARVQDAERVRQAISDLSAEFGRKEIPLDDYEALRTTVEDLAPAFEHAGIDIDVWLENISRGGVFAGIAGAQLAILRDQMADFDASAGKPIAVRKAIRALSDEIVDTADEAEDLKAALDELFGPELEYEAAVDQFAASLDDLRGSLKEFRKDVGGTISLDELFRQDDAGRGIRELLRGQIEDFSAVVSAAAADGAGGKEIARLVVSLRNDMIEAGVKEGFDRKALEKYFNTKNLIPDKILPDLGLKTDEARKAFKDWYAWYLRQAGAVKPTEIDADTRPAKNKVDEFEDGWQQTAADMPRANIDADTKPGKSATDKFADGWQQTAHDFLPAKIDADTAAGKRKVAELKAYINSILGDINDEDVNIELSAQAVKVQNQLERFGMATGGPVPLFGAPGKDSVPAMLMPDEHVATTAEVRGAGRGNIQQGHRMWAAIRRMALRGELGKYGDIAAFADGGPVFNASATGFSPATAQVSSWFDAIAASIGSALSAEFSKKLTTMPSAGMLGPGGVLTPPQLVRGQNFARGEAGKPYLWTGVGPAGYDCSGFQSAVLNAAMGRYPHTRLGSTGTMPWPGSSPGVGRYTIGWFTGDPGHTSGNIAGLGVESSGGVGVRVGGGARSPVDPMFNSVMHYDTGGIWPHGTLGVNMSGGDEIVINPRRLAKGGPVGRGSGYSITASDGLNLRELFKMLLRPEDYPDLQDYNAALRDQKRLAREVGRDLDRVKGLRAIAKNRTKALADAEKELERARSRNETTIDNVKSLERELTQAQRDASREVRQAERELQKIRKNGTKKEVVAAEKALARARKQTSSKEILRIEEKLAEARRKGGGDLRDFERAQAQARRAREKNGDITKRLTKAEKALEDSRERHSKAMQRQRDAMEALRAEAEGFRDTILGLGAAFGGEGTSNSAAGLSAKLGSVIGDTTQFNAAIVKLRKRGLDEDLVRQLLAEGATTDGLALATSVAGSSRAQFSKINAQQARLESIAATTGRFAGGQGDQIQNLNFNAPIYTTDHKKMANEVARRARRQIRMAGAA